MRVIRRAKRGGEGLSAIRTYGGGGGRRHSSRARASLFMCVLSMCIYYV